jgi:hypothetical protein
MNNSEIVERVKSSLRLCAGFDNDSESADRESALDYYHMRKRGDEVAGRSQVVSGDLSAMVEAVLSGMMEAFSTTRIVEFDSFDISDDTQAALESDAVEWFVMKQGNGLMTFAIAIKDALLLRNGFCKVWTDTRTTVETRTLQNVEPEALGELQNIPDAEVTLREYDADAKTLSLSIKRTVKRLRVRPVAPENFVYLDGWHTHDLQEIPICGERHISTRSEMVDGHGFSKAKVERLTAYRHEYKADATARDTGKHQHDRTPLDASQDVIEWYELYVLMDLDGDGVSERYMIAVVGKGDTLLSKEPRNLVPYAAGTAIVMPHRLKGISLWDKLRQNQDIQTGLKRALMDNVNTVTKNRTAYLDGKVEVADLNSGRPNGDIRVRGVARVLDAISPFNVPDLTQGILANIQDERGVRAELGGAALELATGNMQLNDRVGSQGLDRAYSVMEQLSALMTKNIAQTLIRSVFILAHATLREDFTQPVSIKPSGKWLSPIPAQWVARESATIRVGMSPGERARKAATLQSMLTMQVSLAGEGMDDVLVNARGFYTTMMDWARVSDIPNPEQYFIDPESQAAVQALADKQANQEAATQSQQALMSQAIQLEQIRTAMDKYKADQDTMFKYWNAVLGAEVDEAKIVGAATADLAKQQHEGDIQNEPNGRRSAEHTTTDNVGSSNGSEQPGAELGESASPSSE